MTRKLTEVEAAELGRLAGLSQPQVLVDTGLLRAVLWTLALYGERLECARASVEAYLERSVSP